MSIYEDKLVLLLCCVYAAMIGAALGSFLNCAAKRIVTGETFLTGRSHCANQSCQHILSFPDLIPVVSWVFLKGKCRYCGEKVSIRYPLTEAGFAVLSVLCLLKCDLTVLCIRNLIFFSCLFVLSLVDLECREIPDGCLLLSVAIWILTAPFLYTGWRECVLHILAGVVFLGAFLLLSLWFDRILKKESLGGGDIKLFGVCGLYLGFVASLFNVFLACILGLVTGVLLRTKTGKKGGQIPLGPAIAVATCLLLLCGEGVVQWYLGFMY